MKKTAEKKGPAKAKKGPASEFPISIYVYVGDYDEGNIKKPVFFAAMDVESILGNTVHTPDVCARYTLEGVFEATQEVSLKEIV